MQNCDQITELRKQRKHGSITDKDLSKWKSSLRLVYKTVFRVAIEVAAQDWPFLYQKNFQIYMEAYNKAKELELIKAKK